MRRHLVAAVTLAAYLSGCSGWHSLSLTQPVAVPEGHQHLRITLKGGRRLELHEARSTGDSVIGVLTGDTLTASGWVHRTPFRVGFATQDIAKVEDRGFSAGNTFGSTLLVATTIFAVAFIGAAASLSGWR